MNTGRDDDDMLEDGFRGERESRAPRSRGPQPSRRESDDDPRPSRGGAKSVIIILGVIGVLGFCLVGGCVGGFYFLVRSGLKSVESAGDRVHSTNNFKQISLALLNYEADNRMFPPVAMKTKQGGVGLSWRVAILPYVEQNELFLRFKRDEPWDHPDNRRLAAQMPPVFAPKRDAGGEMTHVRVFVGKEAAFDATGQRRMSDLIDGMSNTALIVESTQPVLWIQPDELKFDPQGPLPPLGLADRDYFLMGFADAGVRPVRKSVDSSQVIRAIGIRDGKVPNLD